MPNNKRLVRIDGHIALQFHEVDKWWTCSKADNNDENDFAIWSDTAANIQKAFALIGYEVPIIATERKPLERAGDWYVDGEDRQPKSHREAVRELALRV